MRTAPPPASIYASTVTRRQVRLRRRRRSLPRARLLFAYAALVPLAVAAAERVFG